MGILHLALTCTPPCVFTSASSGGGGGRGAPQHYPKTVGNRCVFHFNQTLCISLLNCKRAVLPFAIRQKETTRRSQTENRVCIKDEQLEGFCVTLEALRLFAVVYLHIFCVMKGVFN